MGHVHRSLGTAKATVTPGGVQLGVTGPASGKLAGTGQAAPKGVKVTDAGNGKNESVRSTPGRTVAGTNKKMPS